MSNNKKIAIFSLLLLNLVFVLGIMFAKVENADAQQSRYAPTKYAMLGYTYSQDTQAIIVFDLRAGKFLVMRWNTTAKRMTTVGLRNFAKDFARAAKSSR